MHARALSWPILAITCFALAFISINAACTKNTRLQTIHASVLSVNVVRDEFAALDLAYQRRLKESATSREEALAKIEAHEQGLQLDIKNGFATVYALLALAATQSDDASMKASTDAVKSLLDLIAKLRGGP